MLLKPEGSRFHKILIPEFHSLGYMLSQDVCSYAECIKNCQNQINCKSRQHKEIYHLVPVEGQQCRILKWQTDWVSNICNFKVFKKLYKEIIKWKNIQCGPRKTFLRKSEILISFIYNIHSYKTELSMWKMTTQVSDLLQD